MGLPIADALRPDAESCRQLGLGPVTGALPQSSKSLSECLRLQPSATDTNRLNKPHIVSMCRNNRIDRLPHARN